MSIQPWTKDDLLKRHLPHRINVLRGFRNRSKREDQNTHCAMKDGAIVTCRVVWSLLGISVNSRYETSPANPTYQVDYHPFPEHMLPSGVQIDSFSKQAFESLPAKADIHLVLVAGNKCVAHLDQYPDHGVTEEKLDHVIDVTLEELERRVK